MHSSKDTLDQVLFETVDNFQILASDVLGRQLHLKLTKADQLKLFNLYTWSDRYKLPAKEILKLLFPIWQGKFSHSKIGLGISVSTLLGTKSKEIVVNYVKKVYGGKENVALYKQSLLSEILAPTSIEEFDDPLDYVATYRSRMSKLKDTDDKMAKKLQRRHWRTNPFV